MLYLADTHALWWYLSGSPQLSNVARAAFDDAAAGSSQVLVPAIVLAEMVLLAEKLRAGIDVQTIVSALEPMPGFRFTPLSPAVALRIRSLTILRDIHDRLIVAEALETGAELISRDQAITACGVVTVVW